MIIALSCFAVGLLVAFIVTVILALRARADVDLLRDRLNQYEEGLSMNQRKHESGYNIGYEASSSYRKRSYGQVSTIDPDDATRSHAYGRRSMSEGQFASLPSTTSGKGGMAKSACPQPGQRRVTFSADDHAPDTPPLLSATTSRDSGPQYTQTQPLAPAPTSTNPFGTPALVQSPPQLTSSPPPQPNFVPTPFMLPLAHPSSLQPRVSDPNRVTTPPIRQLPTTPAASYGGHEGSGYADPYATSHGRSVGGGYPPS
ncbi:hypothetical protein FRC11_013138 [Ceratobasidium sp. 423]|nr:hypothetical protein FRC11_013138 [Ceratobasidium sp. 423]